MSAKVVKKRELVCPHPDCVYYSAEQILVEGEWVLVSYCSHVNSDLIDKGTSCRLYHINWQKQVKLNGNGLSTTGTNGVEILRRRRMAILKMLRWTVNQLDAEERELVFEFVNELKQREEDILKQKKQSDGSQSPNSKQASIHTPLHESTIKEYRITEDIEEETSDNGNLNEFSIVEQTITSRQGKEPDRPRPTEITVAKPAIDPNSPEAIVQRFIECWNTQDFSTEYDLLSNRLHTMPQNEYILSRQHAFADTMKNQNGGIVPKQKLEEIISTKTDNNFAFVECIKSEPTGRFVKEYQQSYSLLREDGNWKISKIRTTALPRGKRKNSE